MELYNVLNYYMEASRSVKRNMMKKSAIHAIVPWLPIVAIIIVAAYLRLYKISEYMTFLGDEGRDVLVVKRMIVDHKLTLLGPTASVGGFFLGPIYYYFMIPFLWLWKLNPTGPAVMVGIVGVATVYLIYHMGKDFFGKRVGLAAASLYALSPLVIAHARSSWNPNLVPFFSTLFIYILWSIVVRGRWKWTLFAGICFGIGLQLHYLFVFLLPVAVLWLLAWGSKKKYVMYALFGLIGFVIGYAPFLAFEMRHGFPNTQSVVRFILEGKDTGFTKHTFWITVSDVVFRIFGRLVFFLPEENMLSQFQSWRIWLWIGAVRGAVLATAAWALMTMFAMARWVKGSMKQNENRTNEANALILLWMLTVAVMFGFYKREIYDYYFVIVFAAPFLLISYYIDWFGRWRFGRWIAWVALAYLLFLNWNGRPFRYPPNNQLGQTMNIARTAFDKTGGAPFNFALITDHNSDHAYRYFFEIWGNSPVTIENEEKDPERKTVTKQLIVMCENPDCKPLGHPLWEVAGFGQAEIDGFWDVPFVRIFKLRHSD